MEENLATSVEHLDQSTKSHQQLPTEPEIKEIELTKETDFIFLGSDGIVDKLSNQEVSDCIWSATKNTIKTSTSSNLIHETCGKAANEVISLAMNKGSFDNVTGVVVGLKGLKKWIDEQKNNQAGAAEGGVEFNSSLLTQKGSITKS